MKKRQEREGKRPDAVSKGPRNSHSREPRDGSRVEACVRRFTVEELDRLARVLRLLDSWDRAQRSAKVRKVA